MSERPRRYSLYDPGSGKVEHILDFRSQTPIPDNAPALDCDFCCQRSARLWRWTVRPFCCEMARGKRFQYDGGFWCACASCRPLVDARAPVALAARASIILRGQAPPESALRWMYEAVFACIETPAPEWRAGQPWRPPAPQA